jgi:hypothetical protein
MTTAKTLLQLAGADLSPPKLRDACLVLIDLQNEYLSGPVAVLNADAAIGNAARLLSRARESGAPVFHVAHRGRPGGLFDRDANRGRFVEALRLCLASRSSRKRCPTLSRELSCSGFLPRPDAPISFLPA